MNIVSLGLRTNFIFSRFSGEILDRGNYLVIRTPSNPGYHWGNFIIFDRPPMQGDLKMWRQLFDKEFPNYVEPHHYLFAWEAAASPDDYKEFIAAGYELEPSVVLTAKSLHPPPYPNNEIAVRRLQTDQDWEDAIDLQLRCADPKYLNDYHAAFKRAQFAAYRKLSEAGRGFWFGAYIDDKLVADLGLFYEDQVGRYQSVETHPDFRKRGICGTLVYEVGRTMMKEFGLTSLVMEADPDYHAARIYESVGFSRGDTTYSLSWWRGKK